MGNWGCVAVHTCCSAGDGGRARSSGLRGAWCWRVKGGELRQHDASQQTAAARAGWKWRRRGNRRGVRVLGTGGSDGGRQATARVAASRRDGGSRLGGVQPQGVGRSGVATGRMTG
jgi:hypothetical protein